MVIETMPSDRGITYSWYGNCFVNAQVLNYEAIRRRWILINSGCHYNYDSYYYYYYYYKTNYQESRIVSPIFTLNYVSWMQFWYFAIVQRPSLLSLLFYFCSRGLSFLVLFLFTLFCHSLFSASSFSSEICYPPWAPHTNLLGHLIFLTPNLGLFLANCWQ